MNKQFEIFKNTPKGYIHCIQWEGKKGQLYRAQLNDVTWIIYCDGEVVRKGTKGIVTIHQVLEYGMNT